MVCFLSKYMLKQSGCIEKNNEFSPQSIKLNIFTWTIYAFILCRTLWLFYLYISRLLSYFISYIFQYFDHLYYFIVLSENLFKATCLLRTNRYKPIFPPTSPISHRTYGIRRLLINRQQLPPMTKLNVPEFLRTIVDNDPANVRNSHSIVPACRIVQTNPVLMSTFFREFSRVMNS